MTEVPGQPQLGKTLHVPCETWTRVWIARLVTALQEILQHPRERPEVSHQYGPCAQEVGGRPIFMNY